MDKKTKKPNSSTPKVITAKKVDNGNGTVCGGIQAVKREIKSTVASSKKSKTSGK